MRVFLTLSALLVGLNAPSQTTFWNPDADGNGYVSASDLLPFLGVFGLDFEATPLYCQDTASFTAHFVFDPNGPSFQDVTIEPPLIGTVFCTCENASQYDDPILVLPSDNVPNGYRVTVVNACWRGVDVGPMNAKQTMGLCTREHMSNTFFSRAFGIPFTCQVESSLT